MCKYSVSNSIMYSVPKSSLIMTSVPKYSFPKDARLCIPSVPISVSRDAVLLALSRLNIGRIYYVREIPFTHPRTEGTPESRRITFRLAWYDNPILVDVKQRIKDGLSVCVVYDFPKFWELRPQYP